MNACVRQAHRRRPWSLRAKPGVAYANEIEKHLRKTWRMLGPARALRIAALVMALTVLFGVVLVRVLEPASSAASRPWLIDLAIVILFFVLSGTLFAVSSVMHARVLFEVRQIVVPRRAQVCPLCRYDLTGRPRNHTQCPECGMACPRRECVRLWCKLLRSRI